MTWMTEGEDAFLEAAYEDLTHIQDDDQDPAGGQYNLHTCSEDCIGDCPF